MKKTLTIGLLLAIGVSSALAAETWITSYPKALALSKKTGKPILANFTGSDWCVWCKKLGAEVFSTPQFKTWAKKNVVLLELDYPAKKPQPKALKAQNQKLLKKYAIEGYPTILFLNAKGARLGQTGYVAGGPKVWLPAAEKAMKGTPAAAKK